MGHSTGTLDLDLMWIEDPDPKTTFPPHEVDPDLSRVLWCVTVLRDSA